MIENIEIIHNFLTILLFFTTYIFSLTDGRNYSMMVTSIITIIVELLAVWAMYNIENVTDLKLLNFLWFSSFALFDFLLAFGIYYFQRRFGLMFSLSAYITIAGYMLLGYLQLITYYDHVYLKSGLITGIYGWFIPLLSNLILFSQIALMLHRMLFPHPVVKYFARS